MNNDSTKNQSDVSEITSELHEGRLSRRGLSDRLKGLGLGFGAAFVLGMTGAQAATAPDSTVVLKSTIPAVNAIIQNGTQSSTVAPDGSPLQQLAWFRRYFHRFFNRWYRRW
jgi:hypothetical protein